jgi:ribonuclease BN (tRNA processing enzyme)
MKLTFLGTRGEIEIRSKRHGMHSSLLVSDGVRDVMVDCGADWAEEVRRVNPCAIVLTHAHADHAGGVKGGSACIVFASYETWQVLKRYPIEDRRQFASNRPFRIGQLTFEAFPVEHSLRAPAVGFRIAHGQRKIFYVPDVALLTRQSEALRGTDLYIGDGATIARPLIRRRGNILIGHAPIATQLQWCRRSGVQRAIFTHCGSPIVAGNEGEISARIRELGRHANVDTELAYDGLQVAM